MVPFEHHVEFYHQTAIVTAPEYGGLYVWL